MQRSDDTVSLAVVVDAAADVVRVDIVVHHLHRNIELIDFQSVALFDPCKKFEPLNLHHIKLDESRQVLDW